MNLVRLRNTISNFSRHTYAAFIVELFSAEGEKEGHEGFHPLPGAGEDVFYQPLLDSYGGSIHRVYLLHFPPWQLFHPRFTSGMDDPILAQRLARIRNLYKGESGYWGMVAPSLRQGEKLHAVGFITNLTGVEREVYDDFLIPAYQRLKRRYGLKKPPVLIGSCDSFVDLVPEKTQEVFANFVNTHQEGIAILLSESAASVNGFVTERCLSSGVLPECKLPYEPALVSYAVRKKAMLAEFESLINSEASEKKLEEFIATHYKEIFGAKYDRVETQLWLRFSQLDISGKCRRLDIFT